MAPRLFSVMPREPETPGPELTEKTPVRTRLGFLVSATAAVVTVTLAWAGVQSRLDAQAKEQADIKARVERVETALSAIPAMQKDLEWITKTMQDERRRKGE